MPNVTIQEPDDKMEFFMELINNLGFAKAEKEKAYILTEEQIQLVEKEIRKIKEDPSYLLDWQEVRKSLSVD